MQQLANVADVTVEVNAGTVMNAPIVMQQISDMIVNNSIAVRDEARLLPFSSLV